MNSLRKYEAVEYKYGANGPFYNGTNWPKSKKIDCSATAIGFFYELSRVTGEKELMLHSHRKSSIMAQLGSRVPRAKGNNPFKNLKVGDLMFFDTDGSAQTNITHVGVYVGGRKMRHAGRETGVVTVDLLKGNYYTKRFLFGKRIMNWENGKLVIKK